MAEILHVSAGEFFALTITTARIWEQNVITLRRQAADNRPQHPSAGRPLRRGHAEWSAMNQNDHRIFFTRFDLSRRNQPALNAQPFVSPLDTLRLAPTRCHLGIIARQGMPFTDWTGPDFRRRVVAAPDGRHHFAILGDGEMVAADRKS